MGAPDPSSSRNTGGRGDPRTSEPAEGQNRREPSAPAYVQALRIWFPVGILVLLVLLAVFFQQWNQVVSIGQHESVDQLQELPIGAVAHLEGVVTFIDENSRRFWLQDATGAVALDYPAGTMLHAGSTVTVQGTKMRSYDPAVGPSSVGLANLTINNTNSRITLPAPLAASIRNFPDGNKTGMRAELRAIVRAVDRDRSGRPQLTLADSGPEVTATLADSQRDLSSLINARVRVIGATEVAADKNGLLTRSLWVRDSNDVEIESASPSPVPLYSVRSLYADRSIRDGRRVRLRGRMVAASGASALVEDDWGAIACQLSPPQAIEPGAWVEITGFPAVDGVRIDLSHCVIDRSEEQSSPPDKPIERVLTSVAAVRQLSVQEANRALPVRIVGVITYHDSDWRQLFFQDETAGIFIKYSGSATPLAVGDKVTVMGITDAGDFAPVIVAPRFRVSGKAPLPQPLTVTALEAASGVRDSQFVIVEGIVHALNPGNQDRGHQWLELYSPFGQVHIYPSPAFKEIDLLRKLEDARVQMRGAFGTVFNSRRQLVGYQLSISSIDDVEVIEPALYQPFETPPTSIGSVLRFSTHAQAGHRIRVQGSVTFVGRDHLYVQDETGGVEVRAETDSLHVGDQVDLVGYPAPAGGYSPSMTDATVRLVGHEARIVPQLVAAHLITQGQYDSQLVSVEGRLLAAVTTPTGKNLILQSGALTFNAELDTSDSGVEDWRLQEGSTVRLTGICQVQIDPAKLYLLLAQEAVNFRILLRSADDITVLQAAPWWTPQRTLRLLGALTLLILAALVWVSLLRRRVRLQEDELHKAAETAHAIDDLVRAMDEVSAQEDFSARVSVRGTEPIAQLVVEFNNMLAELEKRDRARMDAEAKLQQQALTDELTGLPNRRLLADRLSQTLALAQREGRMVALLYIDLDGFKLVNDSLGHAVGDLLLCQVSDRLRSRIRQSDTLARLGGDEFTVVLTRMQKKEDAEVVSRSLLDEICTPFMIEGHEISIAASIGVSLFPENSMEAADLLQQADSAMYAAKRNGKNRAMFFTEEIGTSMRERLTLDNQLRRALANKEISVHYQPEFDLATGQLTRFEALARWNHPTLGSIPPAKFIPLAEESGLIIALGAYVMERACTEAAKWQNATDHPIQVAVNVSSFQFVREGFVDEVLAILHRAGLSPKLLQIELTESATLNGLDRAARTIHRLRNAGISVAIDDFGTGYSCLSYLPKLSFDALKIDRSFIHELSQRPEAKAMVHSLITLAQNLGMKVIVEGVETATQLELVKTLGGHEVQGYLLGRPTPDPASHFRPRKQENASPLSSGAKKP